MFKIQNKFFDNFTELCNFYGLPDSWVRCRIKRCNWTLEEALEIVPREKKSSQNAKKIPITLKHPKQGILKFNSIKDAAKYFKLPFDNVYQRLNRHEWTIEQALELAPPPKRTAHNKIEIEVDGRVFNSKTECTDFYGLDLRLVDQRIKREGWTLEEALGIVPRENKCIQAYDENGDPNYGNIYLISNKINSKNYVGITVNDIEKRFNQHIYSATPRDPQGSLHFSINKYGSAAFYVKLIEKYPLAKIQEREKYWIKFFDSYQNGYNQNIGGAGVGGKTVNLQICFNKKTYSSVSHLERSLGINNGTLSARLRQGMTIKQALEKSFRKSPKTKYNKS